jgi:ssDNA-binding Zn-finger/Zn-ribbon topoisomerase 1
MKVTVRIHTPSGLRIKKCRVSNDGKHLLGLGKETKKKAGWKPEIGTMEVKRLWFGRTAYFCDIFPDAEKTWTVNPSLNILNTPKWDKQESKKLIEMRLVEKAGQEPKEKQGNAIQYVILMAIIASIVIQILLSGRVHIG